MVRVACVKKRDDDVVFEVEIFAKEQYVINYAVRTLFGCLYMPEPKDMNKEDDFYKCVVHPPSEYWNLHFAVIDVLHRMNRFEDLGMHVTFKGEDCFVEILDAHASGFSFAFTLSDPMLVQHREVYRLQHASNIDAESISQFFKTPNGPLICTNQTYHDVVGARAAELLHPSTQIVKDRGRMFAQLARGGQRCPDDETP